MLAACRLTSGGLARTEAGGGAVGGGQEAEGGLGLGALAEGQIVADCAGVAADRAAVAGEVVVEETACCERVQICGRICNALAVIGIDNIALIARNTIRIRLAKAAELANQQRCCRWCD